jgi:endonuclease/exonuclease/phosphatase family metal-dependent hydrolase
MRVVVWNMGHKVASWRVLQEIGADIALLSEARAPKGLDANIVGGESTQGRDGYRRAWASAIVTPEDHDLREIVDAHTSRRGRPIAIPFTNSRPGSWTAAVASIPGFGDVTAVSLYGLMDERSDASVHRSLSELAPVFDDSRYNRLLLLGGDLNTWTGWKAGPHLERDRVVLERIRAYGLVDCLEAKRRPGRQEGCPCSLGEGCTHTRTRMDPRYPDVPYQMDYLFASPALAERLVTCEALAHDVRPSPSDHFPIAATFDA